MKFTAREPILEGWSDEKKYRATDENGVSYLLRVCSQEKKDKKRLEFEMMQKAASLGISMCKPVEFGENEEGVYSVQTWIDGADAETVVPFLSPDEQYAYGLDAGRTLSKLHTLPAPKDRPDWETYFNRKIDRKIALYADCPLRYENGDLFIDFLNRNRHLLKDRPQCFQHGDYHIGNMMIGQNKSLVIIDFNRSDFGDPWEEFNRIVWCAQKCPVFASGMVDGYFPSGIPERFWRLLALYTAQNTLGSLPWAIPFGETEIRTMRAQADDLLSWYDGMRRTVPAWYQKREIR